MDREKRNRPPVDYKSMASGKPSALPSAEGPPTEESVLDAILSGDAKADSQRIDSTGDEVFYDPDSYHLDSSGGDTDAELARVSNEIEQALKAKQERRAIRESRKAKQAKRDKLEKLKIQLRDLQASSSDSEPEQTTAPPVQLELTNVRTKTKVTKQDVVGFSKVDPGPSDVRRVVAMDHRRLEKGAASASSRIPPACSVFSAAELPERSRTNAANNNNTLSDSDETDGASSLRSIQVSGEQHLKKYRSGIAQRASDRVESPQLWPHVALMGEFITQNVTFQDLDFRLFVAGELEIVTSAQISDTQRAGRLHLIKQLAYLHGGYSWEVLRSVYAAILSRIEVNNLSWSQWNSEFVHQIQWALVRQQMDSRAGKAAGKSNVSKSRADNEEILFCRDYNRASCSKGDSHAGAHKGRRVTLLHICAKCWLTDRVRRAHPEKDTQCPFKQSTNTN